MSRKNTKSLSYFGFRYIKPSIKLKEFIDCYWFINTSNNQVVNSTEYLPPDGGMGIILNYGDPLHYDTTPVFETCILDGTNTITRELQLGETLNAIGIRFKITGASLFLTEPLNDLKNETLLLRDAGIKNTTQLYYKLGTTKTDQAKVTVIENWLLRAIKTNKSVSHIVTTSIKLIRQHGELLSVKSIADKLGYSQRTIERLFKLQVGMSPKEYSRVLKIEYARSYIKYKKEMFFTDIAYQLNYYDQAHFINQFKSVVGITPGKYSQKKRGNI